MSALMSTFKGSASGENLVEAGALDAEGSALDSANDSLFTAKPDLLQTVAAKIAPAEPQTNAQPATKQQLDAQKQLNDLLSRQQSMGAAKSIGDQGGSNRMKSAQDAAQHFTAKAMQLEKTASGADQKPSASGSFAKAAVGAAVVGTGVTMAAGMVSPAAAATVGAVTQAKTAYDVVAAFEGRSTGGSSFRMTDSKGRESGYVSAAPSPAEQAAAAPASAAFMRKLTQIPGDIDAGRIDLASQGLNGVETAPKLNARTLQDSVAWKGIAGVNRNGLEAARSNGEAHKPEDENLTMTAKAPLPGVFTPPKPLPLMA